MEEEEDKGDKGRALSPESAAATGILSKKLKTQSSEEEDDVPIPPRTRHVSFAGDLPPLSCDTSSAGQPERRGEASPGSRASSKSPEGPARSKSPLRKIADLFRRTPSPKPPTEGGSPRDRALSTRMWLQDGRVSPRIPDIDLVRPGSSRSRHTSSSSERSDRQVPMYPHPNYTTFEGRRTVFEKLSDEVLAEAGLRPGVAPMASVEELSSSGGSEEAAMSTAASSSQATTSVVVHSEPEPKVATPPQPAVVPPPPQPPEPEGQAAEELTRRRRRKGEPRQ